MKITILWNVTPSGLLEIYWNFGGTYWIHIQVRKEYSEDECCTIACKFQPGYMVSYVMTQQPSEHQAGENFGIC